MAGGEAPTEDGPGSGRDLIQAPTQCPQLLLCGAVCPAVQGGGGLLWPPPGKQAPGVCGCAASLHKWRKGEA